MKKKETVIPIVIGMVFIALIVVLVLILANHTKKTEERLAEESAAAAVPTAPAAPASDDGELIDYEEKGIITLADYRAFRETTDPKDSDDWLQLLWDDYLAECKISEYPEDLLNEALNDTTRQYYNFAEAAGMSVEELLESYGVDETTINEVAKDSVKGRLVAKTIASKEGFTLDDDKMVTYLMRMMEYGEKDKDTAQNLIKDYLNDYGARPKDDIYIEMVKDILLENNPK